MNISSLILAAIAVLLSDAVAFGLTMAVRAYLRCRGKRVISCPETANHAAVHVNVVKAAREAVFGKHDIRLDQCSCWRERQNCGQECLSLHGLAHGRRLVQGQVLCLLLKALR
jgi:hypothetical protein